MSELVMPVTPEIRLEASSEDYGRFVAEPLESGYGTTLGNALRRVLLSSLPGAAVTWVRIDGVQHEFSTIPHVKEDTIEFLLNVKELRLRALSDRPGHLFLEVAGVGEVTAADIKDSADYEIVNRHLHLVTMDSADARLSVEFNVEQGTGYTQAAPRDGVPIGVLPLDAIFTPVRKVNYRVESARVGQAINYDRLVLEVWTDGSISPEDAVNASAQLLMEQLSHFARLGKAPALPAPGPYGAVIPTGGRYDTPIEDLGLSVRAYNALKRHNITRVGEILALSEAELLNIRNFGDKSLTELRERLQELGFTEEVGGEPSDGQEPVAGTYSFAPDEGEDEEEGVAPRGEDRL